MNKKIRSVRIKGKTVTIVCQTGNDEDFTEFKKNSLKLGTAEFKLEWQDSFGKLTITFAETAPAHEMFKSLSDLMYA
ncbi:MAG: hypothetical protein IKE01_05690 [Clostridia bacterium]|nr:hypothetical protein [Clostridia bacterium]